MNKRLSPERRKAVVIFASSAAMSGCALLLKDRPVMFGIWLTLEALLMVIGLTMLVKANKKEKEGR